MNIGDKVIIKECHHVPDLVGKEAEVVSIQEGTSMGGKTYPYWLKVDGQMLPVGFREDELEPVKPQDVPEAFKDAFQDEDQGGEKAEA